jgi:ribose transport system permease protein
MRIQYETVDAEAFCGWAATAGGWLGVINGLIITGFNILNVNPFSKDLTTGVIVVVALSAART